MKARITTDLLAAMQPANPPKPTTLFDTEVRNLLLRVNAACTVKTWNVQYRNGAGQRRFYPFGDASIIPPSEARKRAVKLLARVADGEDIFLSRKQEQEQQQADVAEAKANEARTLRRFLADRYSPHYLATRPSGAATAARIEAAWAGLLDTDIAVLTKGQIDTIRAKRRAAGIKPQTINRDVTALKALLAKAVEWGVLQAHPLAAMSQMQEEDDKRVRYLTEEERKRLFAALPHAPQYLKAMTIVALNTGLRRGELFNLQWTDIRDDGIYVRAGTTKTRKAAFVPLNKTGTDALREWRESSDVVPIAGLVFPSPKDATKRCNTFKRAWKTLTTKAKLQDFTFHDCRHDFASRLVQSGIDLYVVKALLRHSTIALTERYAHLAPHNTRNAVEFIASRGLA